MGLTSRGFAGELLNRVLEPSDYLFFKSLGFKIVVSST